jgi:hypothetical protein
MPSNMGMVPVEAFRRTRRGRFKILKERSNLQREFIEVGPDVGHLTENCVADGAFTC